MPDMTHREIRDAAKSTFALLDNVVKKHGCEVPHEVFMAKCYLEFAINHRFKKEDQDKEVKDV